MRITEIRDISVRLEGDVSNAVVSFSEHDVTLLALVTDVVRNGRPVTGLAFNSIGRFAQSGILRHRINPRVLAAAPDELLAEDRNLFCPGRVVNAAMRNEKPGGHGDRAGAVAALELAIWDVNARLLDEPAYATIARNFGLPVERRPVPVYAAGGYYYANGSRSRLRDELLHYRDMGFDSFKMKIGGTSLEEDMERIETALEVAGSGDRLAVDANGRFDLAQAHLYAKAIEPLGLRWYEEPGDPLDYASNSKLTAEYPTPVATGENLFSWPDVRNLVNFGGMRPRIDVFQMDAGLSYGLGEYAHMIDVMEAEGFNREQAFPHGGHLINLHIAAGLGLGGCEAYPGVFQPFGGYPAACNIGDGVVWPTDAPGFGLEQKVELAPHIARLLD
ncbi:MAG: enolase C-terminal domain-like protein [Gammaproteobacteria bacterium]|nr:enolase C-terminal domain-like protein [Gammaproteobacteria bacterium]